MQQSVNSQVNSTISSNTGFEKRPFALERPRFSRLSSEPIKFTAPTLSAEKIETKTSKLQISESLQKRISKTKLCIHNLRGRCLREDTCAFAHSLDELRDRPNLEKTRLCLAWKTSQSCFKGDSCR